MVLALNNTSVYSVNVYVETIQVSQSNMKTQLNSTEYNVWIIDVSGALE